jgi:transposase InsO family protein
MPALLAGSDYAVWRPKAEVFLGLKGLRESLMDFTSEKQWRKVTARAAEWAAAEKAELLSVLFGNDSEEEEEDGGGDVDSSVQPTAAHGIEQGAKLRAGETPAHDASSSRLSKDREADLRRQAVAMIKRSEMAYGHVFSALPGDVALMVKVVPQGWAHGLWTWLERKFQSTASDNINALLKDWHSLCQAEGEPFDLYRARVDHLYVRLAAAQEKPSPRAYAYALINSLLPAYGVVVMALETGMLFNVQDYAKIRWDDVARVINMHERKLVAMAAADAQVASGKAMAVQHHQRRQPSQHYGGAAGAAPRAEHRRCFKCNQVGHLKASCTFVAKPNSGAAPAAAAGGAAQTQTTSGSDQQGKRQERVSAVVHASGGATAIPAAAASPSTSGVSFAAVHSSSETVMAIVATSAVSRQQKRIGVDSMASIHVSSDIDMFLELKPCEPFVVKGMDGGVLEASLSGRLELHLDSNGVQSTVVVEDVYYHPSFAASLLSLDRLTKLGWVFHSDKDATFVVTPTKHKVSLCQDQRVSMLHCVASTVAKSQSHVYNVQDEAAPAAVPAHIMASSAVLELVRLHEQLGHVGFDRMMVMLEKQATDGLARRPMSAAVLKDARARVLQCKACTQGKGCRSPFGRRGLDTGSAPGEVLHMDTNHVTVLDDLGNRVHSYGLNIIDPYSGARFKQHLPSKDLIARAVMDVVKLIQRQSDWKVKRLYSDGGGEFVNGTLREFAASEGILLRNSPAKTQQLDGVAERVVRTGKDMERTMLLHAGLDAASYYKLAAHHAVFVWNRSYISPQTGVTPFEAMYKRKPSMQHWAVFGCDCFYHVPKDERKTYEPKMLPGIYLGHDTTRNCPTVQDVATGRLVYTRDVRFREARFTHAAALRAGEQRVRQLVEAGYSEDESAVPAAAVEPLELDADEKEWEVDAIVGRRVVDGSVQYRVRWAGYSDSDATWEPLDHLDNAAGLIDAFEALDHQNSADAAQPEPASAAAAADGSAEIGAAEEPEMQGEPQSAGPRRSARSHASSRALDGVMSVSVSGKHVHMAMAALSGMQPGGDMSFTEPQMVHAVSTALAQLQERTPSSYREAMTSPEAKSWKAALDKEMASINEMGVWDLVPRISVPRHQTVLRCKWVFKIKTDEHGAVTVFKARLTPKGFMQKEGVNVYETFAATGKYKSMRIGLSIAAACDYELDQMDVPVAFQQAGLDEEVFMELPDGYREGLEHLVCKLRKALYGLKQGPRNWWLLISDFLVVQLGFKATVSDPCLFWKRSATGRLLLLFLFVDDMQIGYHLSDLEEWCALKAQLVLRFNTKDMGASTWILGMRITRNRRARTITLDQELYVTKALERYGMRECKPVSTPETPGGIDGMGGDDAETTAPADLQLFQEMVGTLMYAAVSCRLDIAHAVHALASEMQAPTGRSMLAAKRVLRYLAGTKDIGLVFGALAGGKTAAAETRGHQAAALVDVSAYADADWANNKKDRKSITGWVAKLNGDCISWSSKKQRVVALSTCEAELYAEAAALQEVLWLRDLLTELGLHVQMGSLLHGDNQSTIAVSKNGVKADRTKHVDVKYHFVTQTVQEGKVQLRWIPTAEQQADIFTKALAAPVFERLRQQLMSR